MMAKRPAPKQHQQRGLVGLLMLLVLMMGVIFVQIQAMQTSTSNSLDARQSQDNLAALYLAESGMERARSSLTLISTSNPSNFQTACDSYRNGGSFALGDGSFEYLDPQQASSASFCAVKVVGIVGSARRVLHTAISFTADSGSVGFGNSIVNFMSNPYDLGSVGLFNVAWRRHGSTGHNTSGGNATANACVLPSCVPLWTIDSSSGDPSVGSLGTAVNLAAASNAQIAQSLSAARNFVSVGILLPGLTGPPVITGSFANDKQTTNTKNNAVTTGDTSSGEADHWCQASDTLVFGLSGRANDDVTATYTAMVFNANGNPAQPIAMTRIAHAPNTDGSTPDAWGDVLSEIWFTHNPYAYATHASSIGTTVTLAAPISLKAGTILKVYSGSGLFAGSTRVVSTVNNVTQFQVDRTPMTPLNNATVCGGICALFNNPSSMHASTQFKLTRSTNTAKEWAGGFTCLAGVDPSRINAVTHTGVKQGSWREVISSD